MDKNTEKTTHTQTDLGKAVTACPLLVQIVPQQPLTHILHNLDESQVSEGGEEEETAFTLLHYQDALCLRGQFNINQTLEDHSDGSS